MSDFLHPRYWPTWLGLAALRLLVLLPLHVQIDFAQKCGHLLYYLLKRRRHITEVNIQVCFPHLSATEQKALVKQIFANNAAAVVEAAVSWWWDQRKLASLVSFKNFELLEQAQAEGNGVLLVGGHFTSIEISSRLLSTRKSFAATYRKQKNALMDHVIKSNRHKFVDEVIERKQTRRMLKALKNGHILWYAPDQDYGRNYSVFVPFFGVPAATITATSKLIRFNDSALVFIAFHRRADNKGYELVFSRPKSFKEYPSGDDETDAITFNTELEKAIKKDPAQYMWAHRRFKSQPDGNREFYNTGYKEFLAQREQN